MIPEVNEIGRGKREVNVMEQVVKRAKRGMCSPCGCPHAWRHHFGTVKEALIALVRKNQFWCRFVLKFNYNVSVDYLGRGRGYGYNTWGKLYLTIQLLLQYFLFKQFGSPHQLVVSGPVDYFQKIYLKLNENFQKHSTFSVMFLFAIS